MRAIFSEGKKQPSERARLICQQTHGTYVVTGNPLGGFSIYCNGYKFAERSTLAYALLALQKDAELAVKNMLCHRPYEEKELDHGDRALDSQGFSF